MQSNAISSLSTVAGSALLPHLRPLLEALMAQSILPSQLGNADVQGIAQAIGSPPPFQFFKILADIEQAEAAQKAGESVACAVEEESVHEIMSEFVHFLSIKTPVRV
jgi:hypothetical protein